VWAQIRADVLGVPHLIAAHTDATPLGAAMIAAVAAGIVPDLAAAAALAPAPTHTHVPDDGDALDEAYRRYRTLVAQLAPLAESPWYVEPPADR